MRSPTRASLLSHLVALLGFASSGMALPLLGGCAAQDDGEAPQLVSSSLQDGEVAVDPDVLTELELEFDEPMRTTSAQVTLTTFSTTVELPLSWSASRSSATVSLDGALVVDRRYILALEAFSDEAGNPLAPTALRFSTKRVDREAPQVLTSSPSHLQEGVYPAAVIDGLAPRVRILLRFGEAMDPDARELRWGEAGGELRAAMGVWSSDLLVLTLDLVAPPFAGGRPLRDLTTYEIELQGLRDLAGNPAQLSDSANGRLRFTTGVYDALLNHSCGHVAFGPFAEVLASMSSGVQAPRSDTAHTRFTITLPGAAGAHAGFTRLRAATTATWHLFLDGDYPLTVQDALDQPISLVRSPSPGACSGITHRVTFSLSALDQVFVGIGPIASPVAHFIVEQEVIAGGAAP
jgi:Bacterial Ig-like domain